MLTERRALVTGGAGLLARTYARLKALTRTGAAQAAKRVGEHG
jgi:hypothetical protein